MGKKRFHSTGLKRIKFRATWSKYNLYNLSRLKLPQTSFLTYYQQKWASKSITRAYHGEFIREGQWERMFSPLLNAVIPMNHRYLAEHDGSELAAGRGSGRDEAPTVQDRINSRRNPVPYMNMTYAPMERRLDMAIWRALFASSARQARQFVVHGQVKVNGKKMEFPGYLLNPGDMFQVEPDRVLFATGARKEMAQIKSGRTRRRRARKTRRISMKAEVKDKDDVTEEEHTEVEPATTEKGGEEVAEKVLKPSASNNDKHLYKIFMPKLQSVLASLDDAQDSKKHPSAKLKIRLRDLTAQTRTLMSKARRMTVIDLNKELAYLTEQMSQIQSSTKEDPDKKDDRKDDRNEKKADLEEPNKEDSEEYQAKLAEAIQRIRDNPVDETKPYATPWRPRPFMSAFTFIPRYLEVNHKICSAVYLRHPVARPGMAEVPTPFPQEIQQLAFNWYLRRR